ncbi:PPP family 3-phenylpropionic acid transporter [Fluviicoccus keumensis]|uniref:PPP family 3-phenylpropionic acid transporter n=1 Tax=Fluviicoccus keumensis TaxID=1435465 RepID=A0A4Q7ZDD7_9GAMM|nr:MFS transporter [Fluviicoccus keumensis]RZU48035.1 PPP family 3-phenylpropionic acid transporter [Fluviicoccus keumensis]
MPQTVPYWRLSAFYLSYLGLLGGFIPYWNLYLARELHFSPALIGQLMALTLLPRLLAPGFWGRLADRSGRALAVVRLGTFMLAGLWLALTFTTDYVLLALLMLACTFFQNAVMAPFEAVTLAHLGPHRAYYGRIRLWGSLGFMAMVAGLGGLFDRLPLHWLPLILAGMALAVWLVSLSVPEAPVTRTRAAAQPVWPLLRRPEVAAFLGAGCLLQMANAPYYAFYSLFLESRHYPHLAIGALWALGMAAEVLAFTQLHRLLGRFGARPVLLAAMLLAAGRWWGIGLGADHAAALVAMQLLQAASFAAVHAASMQLVAQHFGEAHRGRGQALYGLAWGVGTSLGAGAAGLAWNTLGGTAVFSLAAGVALTGWLWLWRATATTTARSGLTAEAA